MTTPDTAWRHVSTSWSPVADTNELRIVVGEGAALVNVGTVRRGWLFRVLRWLGLSPRTVYEAGHTYTLSYWTREMNDRTILLDGVTVAKEPRR